MKEDSAKVILYLSKNFRKKISLHEIAELVCLSPFHFHRKFVEENNCTPQNYLERIRMQHATHILKAYPNWLMAEIAFECGYSSPSIFSRAFKKMYGISPSKYQSETSTDTTIDDKAKNFQIQYFSKKVVSVKKVSLIEKELNLAYKKLIDSATSNLSVFGFFMDAPFHVPLEECRYFIGVETSLSESHNSVLTIPSGYYASFIIQGDFNELKEMVFKVNRQIAKIGYAIDSLNGIERLKISKKSSSFNYMRFQREIFMKIKRV